MSERASYALERAAEDAITHLRGLIATSMPELSIPDSTALSSGSKQALVDGNAFPDDVQWFFSHGSDSATEIDTKIVDDGIQLLGSFKIGDLVRLHGLQSKIGRAWNGCRGVVIGHAYSVGFRLPYRATTARVQGVSEAFPSNQCAFSSGSQHNRRATHRCGDASVLEAVEHRTPLVGSCGRRARESGSVRRCGKSCALAYGGPMSKAVLRTYPLHFSRDMRQLWRAQASIRQEEQQEDLDASRNRPLDALHVETDATEFIIQTQLTRAERDGRDLRCQLHKRAVWTLVSDCLSHLDPWMHVFRPRQARVVLLSRHVSKADSAQVATVTGGPVLSTDTRLRGEHVGRVRVVPHTDLGRARHAAIAHALSRNGICILISSCVSSDQTPCAGHTCAGPFVTVVLCRPAEAMLEQWEAGFRSPGWGGCESAQALWPGNHQEQKQNACSLRILFRARELQKYAAPFTCDALHRSLAGSNPLVIGPYPTLC